MFRATPGRSDELLETVTYEHCANNNQQEPLPNLTTLHAWGVDKPYDFYVYFNCINEL